MTKAASSNHAMGDQNFANKLRQRGAGASLTAWDRTGRDDAALRRRQAERGVIRGLAFDAFEKPGINHVRSVRIPVIQARRLVAIVFFAGPANNCAGDGIEARSLLYPLPANCSLT